MLPVGRPVVVCLLVACVLGVHASDPARPRKTVSFHPEVQAYSHPGDGHAKDVRPVPEPLDDGSGSAEVEGLKQQVEDLKQFFVDTRSHICDKAFTFSNGVAQLDAMQPLPILAYLDQAERQVPPARQRAGELAARINERKAAVKAVTRVAPALLAALNRLAHDYGQELMELITVARQRYHEMREKERIVREENERLIREGKKPKPKGLAGGFLRMCLDVKFVFDKVVSEDAVSFTPTGMGPGAPSFDGLLSPRSPSAHGGGASPSSSSSSPTSALALIDDSAFGEITHYPADSDTQQMFRQLAEHGDDCRGVSEPDRPLCDRVKQLKTKYSDSQSVEDALPYIVIFFHDADSKTKGQRTLDLRRQYRALGVPADHIIIAVDRALTPDDKGSVGDYVGDFASFPYIQQVLLGNPRIAKSSDEARMNVCTGKAILALRRTGRTIQTPIVLYMGSHGSNPEAMLDLARGRKELIIEPLPFDESTLDLTEPEKIWWHKKYNKVDDGGAKLLNAYNTETTWEDGFHVVTGETLTRLLVKIRDRNARVTLLMSACFGGGMFLTRLPFHGPAPSGKNRLSDKIRFLRQPDHVDSTDILVFTDASDRVTAASGTYDRNYKLLMDEPERVMEDWVQAVKALEAVRATPLQTLVTKVDQKLLRVKPWRFFVGESGTEWPSELWHFGDDALLAQTFMELLFTPTYGARLRGAKSEAHGATSPGSPTLPRARGSSSSGGTPTAPLPSPPRLGGGLKLRLPSASSGSPPSAPHLAHGRPAFGGFPGSPSSPQSPPTLGRHHGPPANPFGGDDSPPAVPRGRGPRTSPFE